MEGYPAHYVSHNLPFVILFGLVSTEIKHPDPIDEKYPLLQEKGIYISSDLPSVTGPAADALLSSFRDFDAKDAAWNNRPGKGKMGTTGFTYRTVGRAFTLPARKAKPPSPIASPAVDDDLPRRPSLTPVLHSPLSPLSPDSPTYPDGIMTPFWFSKHQWLLPSALISFFNFSTEPTSTTLQDNKLKSEINALKTSLATSGYRIRLVVVLVAEGDDFEGNFNDRLGLIRRGTSMDAKSLFLIPANLSTLETQALVGTILASIQPSCMEYYRDLSKHARRKRNRGSVPPPTAPPIHGTSYLLSPQGWNIRYETKLGFFAEFRQEMDAAGTNYESAYELLLDGDVFESIANWSPRFDETRLLADTLAIRILRCLLWTGQTTAAVQSWSNHRARIQDLIDRKGKGSGTYGWESWEARWSAIMAELIEKVDVPIFHIPQNPKGLAEGTTAEVIPDVYAIPEKAYAAEDLLPPWDLLHHEGYWLRRAAQRTRARRKLAMAIPKEDRNSPGASPASQIASKVHLYDTYLCPEPHKEYGLPGHGGFDHGALLVETLGKAVGHFSKRHQNRAVERLRFEMAREYMRSGLWQEAMNILKPLWQMLSWRREGWWKLVEEMSWAVRACARHLGDGEALVAVEWELLSNCLTPRTNWQYDITKCLDGLDIEDKPLVVMDFKSTAPCLSAALTFAAREGRVGEPIHAQLTIISQAHGTSAAITLSEVTVAFAGGLKDVSLKHNPACISIASTPQESTFLYGISQDTAFSSTEATPQATEVDGQESSESEHLPSQRLSANEEIVSCFADLKFAPGMTKVYTLTMVPRDAVQIRAANVTLKLREELFDLTIVIPSEDSPARKEWWVQNESNIVRRRLNVEHAYIMKILPKPPKLRIELPNLRKAYYADEEIEIELSIINDEEDEAEVVLHMQFVGSSDRVPPIHWALSPRAVSDIQHDPGGNPLVADEKPSSVDSPSISLGRLAPSAKISRYLLFRAPQNVAEHTLDLKAHYHISTDPQTSILKALTTDLTFIMPFDADYRNVPLVDSSPFLNYFHFDDELADGRRPAGLKQQWSIAAKITSYAMEPLVLHSTKINIMLVPSGTKCSTMMGTNADQEDERCSPSQTVDRRYEIEIQKLSAEDRRTSSIECQLEVVYSLESDPKRWNRSIIDVPPLVVLFGEPRVIATATEVTFETGHARDYPIRQVDLVYTLENPSAHLLDFMLTMDASEDFAFSGPKNLAVQMPPISKYSVAYRIQKTNSKEIIRPKLKILDVGFDKVLKVQAGSGCDSDDKGLLLYFFDEQNGGGTIVDKRVETTNTAPSKQPLQTSGEAGTGKGLRRSIRGSIRGLLGVRRAQPGEEGGEEKKQKRSTGYF